MGNLICSSSFSCDGIISSCQKFTARQVGYTIKLKDNLEALEGEFKKLIEARDDVRIRVIVAEQQQMKRLEQVQGWLSRVEDVETEVRSLMKKGYREVRNLCFGGFLSKNCVSSYKHGKKIFEALKVVENLRSEGDFKEVAQTVPENSVDERPISSTIVGLQQSFDKVWRCLTEEQAGIIGIYGMGGVGKTTLLTQLNNKLLHTPNNFDVVIWAVVSKDLDLEKIQESIAKKIGLLNESWKSKSLQDRAMELFKILSKKKFLLLLDDIWEEVDLTKVGLPPSSSSSASKVIFTTREFEVCGNMEAHKSFKVECLRHEDAWRLFEEKVGRDIIDSHPNIPELAETVAKECGGLPLALIVVGRAMACKKTPREWEHAVEVLKSSASKFSGMEKRVYSRLKLSYDFLASGEVQFCLLYCSLFPEDYKISIEDLIDCWICEGFLDEYDGIGARNHGYSIIRTLLQACLLEEEDDDCVKMHDVIRDMALWIASTVEKEKEKEKFLVLAGVGLTEAPRIGMWKEVTRMSLMNNRISTFQFSPLCSRLQTLFLGGNKFRSLDRNFFRTMTSLRVLKLSGIYRLSFQFSNLVSLQHLDISSSKILSLREELKYLVHLKCLNLDRTYSLRKISRQLIPNLKMLQVLRMFECGSRYQEESSIQFGNTTLLVDELLGLKHLNVLTITLKSSNALLRFLKSSRLPTITQSLCLQQIGVRTWLSVLSLASLRRLEKLKLDNCYNLKELKTEYPGEVKIIRETPGFQSLHDVSISHCLSFRHVTWLAFAPNLKRITVYECMDMEEIIKLDEVPEEVVENLIPFARLQFLELQGLRYLKSICSKALPFPHLKEMIVKKCEQLTKLPLDCNTARERKFIIKGEKYWWYRLLQWDDQATRTAFLPHFIPVDYEFDWLHDFSSFTFDS